MPWLKPLVFCLTCRCTKKSSRRNLAIFGCAASSQTQTAKQAAASWCLLQRASETTDCSAACHPCRSRYACSWLGDFSDVFHVSESKYTSLNESCCWRWMLLCERSFLYCENMFYMCHLEMTCYKDTWMMLFLFTLFYVCIKRGKLSSHFCKLCVGEENMK